MKWEQYKKEIRKGINNHSSEVNPTDIWANIQQDVVKINRRQRRKTPLFFLVLLVGFSLTSGLIYFVWPTDQNLGSDYTISTKSSINNRSEMERPSNSDMSKEDYTTATVYPSSLKDDVANDNEEAENLISRTRSKSSMSAVSPNLIASDELGKSALPNNSVNVNSYDIHPSYLDNNLNSTQDVRSGANSNSEDNANQSIKSNSVSKILADNLKPKDELIQESDVEVLHQFQSDLDRLPRINIRDLEPLSDDNISDHNFYPDISDQIFDYSDKTNTDQSLQKNLTFSLGLVAGVSQANKSYGLKDRSAASLLELRKSTESSLEASHLGLSFSIRHASGLEFSSGVIRTSIAERFDHTTSTVEFEMIDGVVERRIHLTGDTVSIFGEIQQTKTAQFSKKVYNTYNLYEVPLIMGYVHDIGNWKIGGQLGLVANLALHTEGRILSNASESIDLEANQSELFKDKVGLSYYCGVSVQRRLFSNVDLSISPFVKIYPSDFTVANYEISQKYVLFGGQIGLNYTLGR